jgi:lysophospholipase L1-like esterase
MEFLPRSGDRPYRSVVVPRLLAVALVALLVPASASAVTSGSSFQDGADVRVGDPARLVLGGLRPAEQVTVAAYLADGTGGCCVAPLVRDASASPSGGVELSWRWPMRFLRCGSYLCDQAARERGYDRRDPWLDGDRVDVWVFASEPEMPAVAFRAATVTMRVPVGWAGPRAVGLGDSYSAGEGTRRFDPPTDVRTNRCHRSPLSWERLVADELAAPLGDRHLACSGAQTAQLLSERFNGERPQLDVLDGFGRQATTQLVMLTIGGNDVGFARVLRICVTDPRRCDRIFTRASHDVLSDRLKDLREQLGLAYERIHSAAPAARVLVLGYPELFPAEPHRCLGGIGEEEVAYLGRKLVELNAAIADVATAAGFDFVSLDGAFRGHDVCGSGRWIEQPRLSELGTPRFKNAFHPSAEGYRAMADRALAAWDGPPHRLP